MNSYFNIISIVLLMLGLIVIYRKSETGEDLLFIKLAGYYLLGSFRFNLNKLAIPLGFIIYLVFFYPKSNVKSKRYAALLGLIFFVLGVSMPKLSEYLYERPRQVQASTLSINTIDFQRDWQLIKEKLEIGENSKLEGFDIEYNNDGVITDLRYELISHKDGGLVHYFVNLIPNKGEYNIRPSKIEQWVQYDRLVTAERFFQTISLLNLEEIRPRGPYEYYVITSRGELVNYNMKDNDKFIIVSKNIVKKISNDELPVKGFYISSFGMVKTEQTADRTSYEGRGTTDYFFDVMKN